MVCSIMELSTFVIKKFSRGYEIHTSVILSIFMHGKYCKYLWYVKLITAHHTGVAPVPFI